MRCCVAQFYCRAELHCTFMFGMNQGGDLKVLLQVCFCGLRMTIFGANPTKIEQISGKISEKPNPESDGGIRWAEPLLLCNDITKLQKS